jgi:hypothetical protein
MSQPFYFDFITQKYLLFDWIATVTKLPRNYDVLGGTLAPIGRGNEVFLRILPFMQRSIKLPKNKIFFIYNKNLLAP